MQSAIYGFFAKFIKKTLEYLPHSLLGKIFFCIYSFIEQTISGSVIGRFFKRKPRGVAAAKGSLFGKLLLIPVRMTNFISGKTNKKYENIRSGSGILYLVDNWNLVSIRIYGAALSSFGLIFAILCFLSGGLTLKTLIFCLMLVIFGAICILINRSLKSLFKGSFLLKTFGGFFYDNAANEHSRLFLEDDAIQMKGAIVSSIIGAVLAVCAILLSPLDFLLSVFGAVFVLLVLKHVHIAVFIVAIASPILPTMVLAGCSVLCAFSFALKLMRTKSIKLTYSPLYIPVAIFALSYFLGALTSFTFISSAGVFLIHIAFMSFYFVSYNLLGNEKTYKAITSAFVLMGGLIAAYGILQNFVGVSSATSWVDSSMFNNIKLRVYSTFDNPNVLGEYLVIMIPLAMAFFLRSEKKLHKTVYLGVLALCVLCLILTWSRGAWLGAMLAVMIFLVATDKRWAICALLIIVVVPFIPAILSSDSAIVGRLTSIGNMSDGSTAYRVSIWQSAIRIISDFWLGGIGLGSDAFALVYEKYAAPGVSFALHSHNLFLQIMVEMGIGGFVAFIAILLKYYKSAAQTVLYSSKKKTLRKTVTVACASGITGLMLQGLTDFVWYNYKILLIFWIILAISTSKPENKQKEVIHK